MQQFGHSHTLANDIIVAVSKQAQQNFITVVFGVRMEQSHWPGGQP